MSAKNTKAPATPKKAAKAAPSPAPLSPVDQYWALRLAAAKESFEDNNYAVEVVSTLEDAKEYVLKTLIPALKPQNLTFAGSQTVIQAGLVDALLAQKEIPVINTLDYTIPSEDLYERRRQALLADLLLTSVNAATMDGKLALLDGYGNRSAAVQFGPKHVILLISRNKLVESLSDAIDRTRNITAPMNAIRLSKKTPCAKVGECMDCKSPERICNAWTLMERATKKGRIHIVLVNQDAGF